MSVPQIFFGDQWIGGASDLEVLVERGILETTYRDSARFVNKEIRQYLAVPDESTAQMLDNPAPALNEADLTIGGIGQTYAEVFDTITGDHLVATSGCRPTHLSSASQLSRGGSRSDTTEGPSSASDKESNSGSSGSDADFYGNDSPHHTGRLDRNGLRANQLVQSNDPSQQTSIPPSMPPNATSASASTSTTNNLDNSSSSKHNSDTTTSSTTSTTTTTTTTATATATTIEATPPRSISRDVEVPMLEIIDRTYAFFTYRHCFLGANLVDVLMDRYELQSRAQAVDVGRMLLQLKMFSHVHNDHLFLDNHKYFYRFAAHEEPLVLNTWRSWNDRVVPDAVGLVRRLKKMLDTLISKHRRPRDGLVAYDDVSYDLEFQLFDEATCELQKINMFTLTQVDRLSFCLNIYNMMVQHAFAKVGRPESNMRRDFFFSNVSYNIGGHVYSLNDVENGILRGNKRPAGFHFSRPFGSGDPRLAAVIEQPDARLHFALNCGAKSCPPVKEYTSGAVLEELRVVAMAFCGEDTNIAVDVDKMEIKISKLFHWYMYDFGPTEKILLAEVIPQWLEGEKKQQFLTVVNSGKYKLKKLKYDWTTDAVPTGKMFQGRPRGR